MDPRKACEKIWRQAVKLTHQETVEKIDRLLKERFAPIELKILNESHIHAKHKEARKHPKAGHFRIVLVSSHFSNKPLIQQHRMVYECLAELMPGSIHALALETKALS
jgi:BolA family transcriptional regulator, general stress-responsive regulator